MTTLLRPDGSGWSLVQTEALSRLVTLLRRKGIEADYMGGSEGSVTLADESGYVQVKYIPDTVQFHLLCESPEIDEFVPATILPLLVAGLAEEMTAAAALRRLPTPEAA